VDGFKKFLMQGELVVIAVGLVVALAFSTLIKGFTDSIITPIIASVEGGNAGQGLGFTINGQFVNVGAFLADVVYFVIFMVVIYAVLVVPYRSYMAKRGVAVFGDPDPTDTCPHCLSSDLPHGATKCLHCASDLTTAPGA
jgi:large conductance mechanosensitive channel